jgi:hypothetical protein
MALQGMAAERSATTTATESTSAASRGDGTAQQVLFYGGQWIGLTASNDFGFDVLTQQNGQYRSIIGDAKLLMRAFRWHLEQDGLLMIAGGKAVAGPTARSASTGVAKPKPSGTASTAAKPSGTTGVATAKPGGTSGSTANTQRRPPARSAPVTRVAAGAGSGSSSSGT